jgi:hypothetical protein
MQDHPNRGTAVGAPAPGSPEDWVQRAVLLELVTSLPAGGHEIDQRVLAVERLRTGVVGGRRR